jgi:hypothetical protein
MYFRAEHFWSGPFWTKINNQTDFIFFLVLEPKTGSNRLISVRFGSVCLPSKPIQTEIIPVEFFLGFLLTTFFSIFVSVLAFKSVACNLQSKSQKTIMRTV